MISKKKHNWVRDIYKSVPLGKSWLQWISRCILPILTTYVNVLSVILVSYHFILLRSTVALQFFPGSEGYRAQHSRTWSRPATPDPRPLNHPPQPARHSVLFSLLFSFFSSLFPLSFSISHSLSFFLSLILYPSHSFYLSSFIHLSLSISHPLSVSLFLSSILHPSLSLHLTHSLLLPYPFREETTAPILRLIEMCGKNISRVLTGARRNPNFIYQNPLCAQNIFRDLLRNSGLKIHSVYKLTFNKCFTFSLWPSGTS